MYSIYLCVDKNKKITKNKKTFVTTLKKEFRKKFFCFFNRRIFIKLIALSIFLIIVVFLVTQLKHSMLWQQINSVEKIRILVNSSGIKGVLLYMLLQFLQTTILQIPSLLTTIAGSLVFGKGKAFLLTYISVLIGSVFMFFIGRKTATKILYFIFGKEKIGFLTKKLEDAKYLYFLMMIFPLFPDDLLCLVAGMTDMKFSFFITTNLISRAVGIFSTIFIFGNTAIPFNGWGIFVWILIGLMILILFYLSVKYKEKIDDLLFNRKTNQTK